MTEQSTQPQKQTPGTQVTGTSLTSFDDAAESAFSRVVGDPRREMLKAAEVERMWVTGGGVVGHTQFHVELRVLGADHAESAPGPEGTHELDEHDHGWTCKDFTATLDRMPGGNPKLIVTGTCTVSTGGHTVTLVRQEPQGINPSILMLRIHVEEPEGGGTDAPEDHQVRYEEETDFEYASISILPGGPHDLPITVAH